MGFYEELYHAKSGYERKNHKWVTRTGTPGHYVYTYDKDKPDPRFSGSENPGAKLTSNSQRYITPYSGPSRSYQESRSRLRSRIEGNARMLRPSRQQTSAPAEREPRGAAPGQNGRTNVGGTKSGGSSKSSSGSSSTKQQNTTQTRESTKTLEQLAEAGKKWLEDVFSDKLSEEDVEKLRTRLGAMRLEKLGIYRR